MPVIRGTLIPSERAYTRCRASLRDGSQGYQHIDSVDLMEILAGMGWGTLKKNIWHWPGILASGWGSFMTFIAWSGITLSLLIQSQFFPETILFNAPRFSVEAWIISVLLGALFFTLYGAAKDKIELLAKLEVGSHESPIEPRSSVYFDLYDLFGSAEGPGGLGWVMSGTLPEPKGRVLPMRLAISSTNAVLLEQIELEISGTKLTSGWQSDWLSVGVVTDATVEFALTDKVSKGAHEVRVLGFADGVWFTSKRFTVEVP